MNPNDAGSTEVPSTEYDGYRRIFTIHSWTQGAFGLVMTMS